VLDSPFVREYRGTDTSDFEMSLFEFCDTACDDRMGWVTLTDDTFAQRDSMLARLGQPKSKACWCAGTA
jgi:hypothetical protein